MTASSSPQISKPYPRGGGRFACRFRLPDGRWPWGPRADSEEAATAAAQAAAAEAAGAVVLNLPGPDESPADSRPSAGVRLNRLEHEQRLPEPKNRARKKAPGELRIAGPYWENGTWRCKIHSSAGPQWGPRATTEAEALRKAQRLVAARARQGAITIADAIETYVQGKRSAGARPLAIEGARNASLAFFAGILDLPVGRLTERIAQAQYDKLRQAVDPRTGKVTAVSTHRAYLSRTKSWARWVVKRGWISASPMEGIEGVGRRRRGKKQLSWDEGNLLGATCLAEGSEAGAAVLMCLLMGLRASEVVSRVVRDIDRNGTHIRVDDNEDVAFQVKTDDSRRPVLIPTVVRPLIAQLAAGKSPQDPLFPGTLAGRRRREFLNVEVKRLCKAAGVPVVCPHSLRGWMTSTAISAGELPEVVARGIGHASVKMTLQHYVAPGVAQAAELKRGQAAFTGAAPTLPS